MAKKPILTDDELDGGLPDTQPQAPAAGGDGATRPLDVSPPPPASVTRPLDAPAPDLPGRDASGHARPKTRIHGYIAPEASAAAPAAEVAPTVGWLVVVAGPGRGTSVSLVSGMNSVGRGADCLARVDFGDDTISSEPHAFVTYDHETRLFHLSHGGKTNIVRLNDAPVLSAETLNHGDTIRIGATAMRFVALCGADFDWSDA
ncbi:FHA domain-containing protein [Gymnodinialimonas sp. 2305UL16-5]|uniref:FHA domain-containing protein n=1 Tax=Gymnodinialimonas mytili TaxID=3126503 RepID=UPI0030A1E1D0